MRRFPVYLVLSVSAVTMAWPLLWMAATSLKTPGATWEPTWMPQTLDAYRHVFTQLPFGRYLFNSALVTAVVVVCNVLFGTAAAYAFAKLRFPGRNALFYLLLITLMVPFQVNLIPLYQIMQKAGAIDTYAALIAPGAIQAFGVFLMRQYLMSIPDAVLESARLDGAGELQILWRIVFPTAKPAVTALAIFSFIGAWNDFLWPLIVTNSEQMRTLPVGLALLARKNSVSWPDTMAGAVITILPMIVFFAVLQRRFVEGLTAGAVKD